MAEMLILVDAKDNQIGVSEKTEAHQRGLLHRCFSIFVFNSQGLMLLQRRSINKYHSGGLWTNTCCGHPRDGEDIDEAAHRRLKEEMGFDCPLKKVFTFIYKADLNKGLKEHELDHVYLGIYDGPVNPDPEEADAYIWLPVNKIIEDLAQAKEHYTVWFKIALEKLRSELEGIDPVEMFAKNLQ